MKNIWDLRSVSIIQSVWGMLGSYDGSNTPELFKLVIDSNITLHTLQKATLIITCKNMEEYENILNSLTPSSKLESTLVIVPPANVPQ